ncbi:hypothetical protein T484DRAFT_1761784 [Baffinella frigidus]|nr:hypothetical protein T484DRAFT_1761784 [Cryptophyta sp. CCMP2293]
MAGLWREEDGAGMQWYTVLQECADPGRIEEATGASLGGLIDGEANAYLLAGTEAMARAVARQDCVAWVGARPDAHKIDPTFKGVLSNVGGDASGSTSRPSATSGALSLTTIVVLLLPPGQQFPAGRFSAGDFVRVCAAEFARRGWAATAENASHTRIQVSVDPSAGRAPGDSLTPEVVKWLASRGEVIWIGPRSVHKAVGRFANKLMASSQGGAAYATVEKQAQLTAIMTSTKETGSLDVVASGKYCLSLREVVHVGNRSATGVLAPLVAAHTSRLGVYYSTDTGNVTTGLYLVSAGKANRLSGMPGDYIGMEIHVPLGSLSLVARPLRVGTNTHRRTITHYDPSLARVTIHPGIPGVFDAGVQAEILPVFMGGDVIKVRADGVAWSGTLVLDFLPRLPPVRGADGAWGIPAVDPSELLHMGCDASGDAMMGATALSRLPKTLQALGYLGLRATCVRDVVEEGTVKVQIPAGLPTDGSGCESMCASNISVPTFDRAQVCVFNESAITYTGSFSPAENWCECHVIARIPLHLSITLPEANPVWDLGLSGEGQVVAFADTGADTGSCLLSEASAAQGVAVSPPDLKLEDGVGKDEIEAAIDLDRRKDGVGKDAIEAAINLDRRKAVGYVRHERCQVRERNNEEGGLC